MFEGVTRGAKISGYLGIGAFLVGTLLIGLYVSFGQDGVQIEMLGLLFLWLIIVGLRVGFADREGEIAAFSDVMKWQIAIAAAAAAVIAPLELDAAADIATAELDGAERILPAEPNVEAGISTGLQGPIILFLVSSGCAAIGYALLREAEQQLKAKVETETWEKIACLIGRQIVDADGTTSTALMRDEVDDLRREVGWLRLPWWRRLGRKQAATATSARQRSGQPRH